MVVTVSNRLTAFGCHALLSRRDLPSIVIFLRPAGTETLTITLVESSCTEVMTGSEGVAQLGRQAAIAKHNQRINALFFIGFASCIERKRGQKSILLIVSMKKKSPVSEQSRLGQLVTSGLATELSRDGTVGFGPRRVNYRSLARRLGPAD